MNFCYSPVYVLYCHYKCSLPLLYSFSFIISICYFVWVFHFKNTIYCLSSVAV